MTLLADHQLVLPNNGGTSDPNCFCTCKGWQIDPRPLTQHEMKIEHLYHILDVITTTNNKAGGETNEGNAATGFTNIEKAIELLNAEQNRLDYMRTAGLLTLSERKALTAVETAIFYLRIS